MSNNVDLPDGFLCLQTSDAREWCRDCVKAKPELHRALGDESSTVALESDDWYPGGECASCGKVILYSGGRR